MKFMNFAIASVSVAFLAGNANAVDTASISCEEAHHEFNECKDEAYDLHPEILDGAVEKALALEACMDEAKESTSDPFKLNKMYDVCEKSYWDYFQKYCPTEIKKMQTCEFEDFALDLAEELEDEIHLFPCKFMQKEMENETGPLYTCAKDAASKDPAEAMKLKMAFNTLNSCGDAAKDKAEADKCWKFFAEVLIEAGCSAEVKDFEDTCHLGPSFEFEDFDLDLADDEEPTAFATYLRG